MTHHTDLRLIEADIARERAQLASSLTALQDRMSLGALTQDALGLLRANTQSYTRSLDHAVRTNPLAVGLVGAGLAWLAFGNRRTSTPPKVKLAAMSTWEDDGGPARPSDDLANDRLQRTNPSKTGRMVEDHTMITGAVVLALGAALGASFPRTTAEDRAFGAERDRLVALAARKLAEERALQSQA